MSADKIINLWNSMKSKLNQEQAQHLLNLSQVEYNFDFDNMKLISIDYTITRDKHIREMLKKINSIDGIPFIPHIMWDIIQFPINMNKINKRDDIDVFEEGDAILLMFYGLFDTYMVNLKLPPLHINSNEDYDGIIMNFIENELNPSNINSYNKEITEFYNKFKSWELKDFYNKFSNHPYRDATDIIDLCKWISNNRLLEEWWRMDEYYSTLFAFEMSHKFFIEYHPMHADFQSTHTFKYYKKDIQYLFFEKYSSESMQQHLIDKLEREKVFQSRENAITRLKYPIIETQTDDPHNSKYSNLKKELINLLNRIDEKLKYAYIEYYMFKWKNQELESFKSVFDVYIYLYTPSSLKNTTFHITVFHSDQNTTNSSFGLEQLGYFISYTGRENAIYIKEISAYPGNYLIVEKGTKGCSLLDNSYFPKPSPKTRPKKWYIKVGNYISFSFYNDKISENNYFIQYMIWIDIMRKYDFNSRNLIKTAKVEYVDKSGKIIPNAHYNCYKNVLKKDLDDAFEKAFKEYFS